MTFQGRVHELRQRVRLFGYGSAQRRLGGGYAGCGFDHRWLERIRSCESDDVAGSAEASWRGTD